VRWAFGVYRHTFVQGRSGTLSCFFVFVNHLVFLFRGDQLVEPSSPRPLSRRRFEAASACEGGASYCLVSGRQPPSNFYFRSVGDPSNQLLRSPFFNRRPLRRGRILLIGFRGSTPVENFFSSCVCARRTTLRASLISWPPRKFARAKPQQRTKFFSPG
jgi:hypothetical protein